MLIVLLSWLIQYIVLRAAGILILKPFKNFTANWLDELLIGYCFLSVLSVTLSLFIPINIWTQGVLLTGAIIVLITQIKQISFPKLSFAPGPLLIGVFILILALPLPNHGDSAFYHAQALKWVVSYPVIPGLGNFFSRLAFNSSLFNTQALFSFFPLVDIPSRFLNSFLILIWFLYLYQTASKKDQPFPLRLISLIFAFISLLVTRGWVSTIAPDVTTGLFMLFITYKLSLVFLFGETTPLPYFLVLLFTAVTIKLPALFLLPLFVFYPAIFKQFKWQYLMIPLVILTPWIIRNIILSGYLIYPYFPLVIWEPDWLIPADVAMAERNWIASWARIPATPWQEVLPLSIHQWFPVWFKTQYMVNKSIVLIFCLSFILNIILLFTDLFKRKKIQSISMMIISWSILILIWFLTAPDFRFGYGLILPYLVLVIFHYGKHYFMQGEIWILSGKLAFPLLLGLLMIYVLIKEKTPLRQLVVLPQPYYQIPLLERKIGPQKINTAPGYESCWDSPLPCINDDLFPDKIELRGQTLREGFRPVN